MHSSFLKHELYEHNQAEKALHIKHMLHIIQA